MITLELTPYEDESLVFSRAASLLKVDRAKIAIYRKSVDARHKNNIKIIYTVGVKEPKNRVFEKIESKKHVVIVGAGPAGLFCALTLCRHGIKTTVLERGDAVDARVKKVSAFMSGGALSEDSNVQFGEGGAGAFSDGKLNTGIKSDLISGVLQDFVSFGAPEDILYSNKPHIGSDRLKPTVINLRRHIESLGGRFYFNSRADGFEFRGDKVASVSFCGSEVPADFVVLAIGHSARDTFRTLYSGGVPMESKEFSVGFRIEQLQSLINADRYGKFAGAKTLPPADYKLVSHASDRAVFTFCMCPGGVVIPSSSENGLLVVNGMSNYLRDGVNANGAVICQVKKSDFCGSGPLGGVDFQRMTESVAFTLGGGDFIAPVELASDFISSNRPVGLKGVFPTYSRGYAVKSLDRIFPEKITESLKVGLSDMDKKIRNFASAGAVLTAAETRTSSPVRILRGDDYASLLYKNLYPCGEGCGYAGGIMSAAVDGIRVAESIFGKIKNEYADT